MIKVELTNEDALLFKEFQKHYELIAHILGVMTQLNINVLTNCNVSMDYDSNGIIQHTAITKHYKR